MQGKLLTDKFTTANEVKRNHFSEIRRKLSLAKELLN